MTIKSLLLGSAAALAAVSGAQAADAIVAAEPEPMEYVRVCDAAGTGYFYVPGTETCLRVSGVVRYEIGGGGSRAAATATKASFWNRVRARLFFDSWNDSEYGAVTSWVRVQAASTKGWSASAAGVTNNTALNGFSFMAHASIGGLQMGHGERSPWQTVGGFGGVTEWGGQYGYRGAATYLAYVADLGAGSAYISLEDFGANLGNVAPDIAAGISGSFDAISAAASVGFDTDNAGWSFKGRVSGSIDPVNLVLVALYNNKAGNAFGNGVAGFTTILGASVALTDSVSAGVDFTYNFNPKTYIINGQVDWAVAEGFAVRAALDYQSVSQTTSGWLRLQRSF